MEGGCSRDVEGRPWLGSTRVSFDFRVIPRSFWRDDYGRKIGARHGLPTRAILEKSKMWILDQRVEMAISTLWIPTRR